MKYIRTKDGIYRNASTDKDIVIICKKRKLKVNPKGVIKQADTIEELCDGWIIECPEWETPTFKKRLQYMNWQDYVKTANKHKAIHYAAIFVRLPNGAIRIEPVAKMNEEGELCLI